MSIRFKFRSSVNFDSIEIDGGKPYISVGELRSKILCQKKLNGISHKDFDLVFFDDLTGQEYNDDEFEIPSGSSVIIKRVPAEPVPTAVLRHHKHEASELSDDIPKGAPLIDSKNAGINLNKPEDIVLEQKLVLEDREHIKLEKVSNSKSIDLEKVDLPSELRCPICNTYFKEAVMIPCCQHSFCKKCISEVLLLTSRCPKCCCDKYRVEQLLPNLSLRHAIEHFLESQILATAPETDLQKYVPDGESGIHGKEVSTVNKRKLDLIYPTSAMQLQKGSNQNTADSVYESLNRKNNGKSCAIDLLNSSPLLKVNNGNEDLIASADSQGENQPVMPPVCMPDQGGDRSYAFDNRFKKVRTCYKCNSPTHFIRDCPMNSTEQQQPMFHTGGMSGYTMPYWNTGAYPPVNPYMNMYGNPGMNMMPFSPNMLPYGISPYGIPSTYGALPFQRFEQPLRHSENLDLQNSDNRIKYSHEKRQRASDYEDDGNHDYYHDPERSSEHKSHRDRGKGVSNSEESHGRKLQKDHHYKKHSDQSGHKKHEKQSHSTSDKRDYHGSYHTDKSVSGVEDVHSGNYRYDEVRHKKHHETSRRHHSDSDGSCSHHKIKKEKIIKKREKEDDVRDRWRMLNDSDDDYHHNKRKKVQH